MRIMNDAALYPPPIMVNNLPNMEKRVGVVNIKLFEINKFMSLPVASQCSHVACVPLRPAAELPAHAVDSKV